MEWFASIGLETGSLCAHRRVAYRPTRLAGLGTEPTVWGNVLDPASQAKRAGGTFGLLHRCCEIPQAGCRRYTAHR